MFCNVLGYQIMDKVQKPSNFQNIHHWYLCGIIKKNVLWLQKTRTLLKAPSTQQGWTQCRLRCLFPIRSNGWNFEFQNARVYVAHIPCVVAADKQDEEMWNHAQWFEMLVTNIILITNMNRRLRDIMTILNISYDFLTNRGLRLLSCCCTVNSIFIITSRVAKELTQLHIQWTPAFFLLGAKNESVIHLNISVSYNSFTYKYINFHSAINWKLLTTVK